MSLYYFISSVKKNTLQLSDDFEDYSLACEIMNKIQNMVVNKMLHKPNTEYGTE